MKRNLKNSKVHWGDVDRKSTKFLDPFSDPTYRTTLRYSSFARHRWTYLQSYACNSYSAHKLLFVYAFYSLKYRLHYPSCDSIDLFMSARVEETNIIKTIYFKRVLASYWLKGYRVSSCQCVCLRFFKAIWLRGSSVLYIYWAFPPDAENWPRLLQNLTINYNMLES